jgi:integrase
MAAKVREIRGAWWIVTHHRGKRIKKRVGKGNAAKREAVRRAREIDAELALSPYRDPQVPAVKLACDEQLRVWLQGYAITLKPTTRKLYTGLIENHLVPHFGSRYLDEIRERDLLVFADDRVAAGLGPKTIKNALSVLRHVYSLLVDDGVLASNPARKIGALMRRVENATARETKQVDSWTRREVRDLLVVVREYEPDFAPFLSLLLSTGMRRGEAMGLQWTDVNFEDGILTIRRSISTEGESTPKSGRSRRVRMTSSLASELFDLLAKRRTDGMARGWPEPPVWVFCSRAGTPLDPGNIRRVWDRVRRRAQKYGVRPLRLHDARHTWATFALGAGKSIRWVSDQLGHADPAFTLRVYAHVLQEEETDLSFAEFEGPGRPYTAPLEDSDFNESPNYAESMARREGVEPPTLRFEACTGGRLPFSATVH